VINKPTKIAPDWNFDNPDPASSVAPYRICSIGNLSPVRLKDYIEVVGKAFGKKAIKEFLPTQPGDVQNTFSDVSDLEKEFGYRLSTSLEEGLRRFADWYKAYYKLNR
jgi:UDP-glucuronate 4-epimerase